ncbi:hypothetical protein HYC85_000575 [Camellia sinensis]|uniref:Plastocyanin-like domain-containing protein n=1 Tax=Camellia sinensis TaxID=4442 RepID=A0A7J7I4F4_CAMSI|nr:hypothetical protein HYC85_000575 [Camellia sinensis]
MDQKLKSMATHTTSSTMCHTPLKLADYFCNGLSVYQLNAFPTHSVNGATAYGVSVVSVIHKGWLEIVFMNDLDVMDSWHLDSFGFFVVGFGNGQWTRALRSAYNLLDPVVSYTTQVYPKGWSAVYVYLDNTGMWNLRSQKLFYIRVYDDSSNPTKERPPPENLLLCALLLESAICSKLSSFCNCLRFSHPVKLYIILSLSSDFGNSRSGFPLSDSCFQSLPSNSEVPIAKKSFDQTLQEVDAELVAEKAAEKFFLTVFWGTLVPYPLILVSDIFGDNLGLAEITLASRSGHVAPRLTRQRHLATCWYSENISPQYQSHEKKVYEIVA